MEKLGTNYGGWHIPIDIKLDENSIVYSAGVGEDISFDLLLSEKFDCNIVLIDPTKRAKNIIMKYWIITIQRVGDFREIYRGTIRDK